MSDQPNLQIYSPASVIGIFNNALRLPATVSIIYLKGRYAYGGSKAYGNYYYDLMYSESDSVSVGVKISALLRSKIRNNEIYTLRGYIEKSVKNSAIQLVFVPDEIVGTEERKVSEEDLQRFQLLQEKSSAGFRDLETLIRDKLLRNEKVKVANIYGRNAIVQKDFHEGLDVSQSHFEITEFTCSITSATSVLAQLKELEDLDFDVVGIVRGGGDRQSFEAFDDVTLAKKFISMRPLTVTAIGHSVDESLLDRLSDRRFNLPLDYGNGLHRIIEKLNAEKLSSRAVLIAEVKKDVSKQFEEQVKTLTEQLRSRNKEFAKLQEDSARQMAQLSEDSRKQLQSRSEEMERYRNEIVELHGKNLSAAVQSATSSLQARIDLADRENSRLREELEKRKTNLALYLAVLVAGIIVGYLLSR